MTIQDWLGLTLTSLSILGAIGVAVRWVIRHYIKDILKELKPNSGSSLKDQVTRLEAQIIEVIKSGQDLEGKQKEISSKIDHMYDLFIDYLTKNQKDSK